MTSPTIERESQLIEGDLSPSTICSAFWSSASTKPRSRDRARSRDPTEAEAPIKQLVIINWSGEFDKIMPTLIMATAAAALGYKTKVFTTFWGLLPFVKDQRRIIGENFMQKMLDLMQRPGISHLKLPR